MAQFISFNKHENFVNFIVILLQILQQFRNVSFNLRNIVNFPEMRVMIVAIFFIEFLILKELLYVFFNPFLLFVKFYNFLFSVTYYLFM